MESGIWVQVTAKLKWRTQMFIDFYGFLHWWKSCLLIKNNTVNYYPCTCFLAHKQPDGEFEKLKSWNDLQLQNFHFYQSDKFSAKSICWQASSSQCWRLSWCFFWVCCWTGCISFFVSFFYHFLIKSSLNVSCILWSFWLASIQTGCHTWSTLLMNQVCWKENPSTSCCFLLYPELQPQTKHLTILPCTAVKAYSM